MIKIKNYLFKKKQIGGSEWHKILEIIHPIKMSMYAVRYGAMSFAPPYKNEVDGYKHFRLNLIFPMFYSGGLFISKEAIFYFPTKTNPWVVLFRPDKTIHQVTLVERGVRYVLSISWMLKLRKK